MEKKTHSKIKLNKNRPRIKGKQVILAPASNQTSKFIQDSAYKSDVFNIFNKKQIKNKKLNKIINKQKVKKIPQRKNIDNEYVPWLDPRNPWYGFIHLCSHPLASLEYPFCENAPAYAVAPPQGF